MRKKKEKKINEWLGVTSWSIEKKRRVRKRGRGGKKREPSAPCAENAGEEQVDLGPLVTTLLFRDRLKFAGRGG